MLHYENHPPEIKSTNVSEQVRARVHLLLKIKAVLEVEIADRPDVDALDKIFV